MNESQSIVLPGTVDGQAAVGTRKRAGLLFVVIAIITIAGLALLALGVIQKMRPPLEGGAAPIFDLKTYDGQVVRLSDLRGKAVAVNFWASWCQPCREEAPLLEAAWRKYKDRGFVLIGVDYVDTEPAARAYMKEFKLTYPNGPDVQTLISQAYHITGVPETYFIGKDGKVLTGKDSDGRAYGNWIGPINQVALEERIELLLK